MNITKAKEILAESINENRCLGVIRNEFVYYCPGEDTIILEGDFSLEEIEAILVYDKHTSSKKHSWKNTSSGIYDSNYKCLNCGKEHTTSADNVDSWLVNQKNDCGLDKPYTESNK